MWLRYIVIALAAYLLGNVQFAIILSKWKYHDDVRKHGSGNAGSTNMLRVFGLKPGLLTFAGDFSKGVLAVLLGRLVGGELGAYVAALFVVLGHDFPVFLQFKGGKGVASTFGIAWALIPLFGMVLTVYAVLMIFLTRTIAIVSLSGVTLYLILAAIFYWQNTELLILIVLLVSLVFIRHTDNIKRIIGGEESKLFERKKKAKGCNKSNHCN